MPTDVIYVGTKGRVAAIDRSVGTTLWQTKLAGGLTSSTFVSLLVDHSRVFAHTNGTLYCLDAANGTLLWSNNLPGFGYELASLAVEGLSTTPTGAAYAKLDAERRSASASGAT